MHNAGPPIWIHYRIAPMSTHSHLILLKITYLLSDRIYYPYASSSVFIPFIKSSNESAILLNDIKIFHKRCRNFFVLFADFYSPLLPALHKIRAHPHPLAKQRAYTNFSMISSRLNFTLILCPLAKIKSYSQTPLGFNKNWWMIKSSFLKPLSSVLKRMARTFLKINLKFLSR